MKLRLYNTVDDTNVMNKNLVLIDEYDITLKDDSSVSAITLRLKDKRDNLNEIANYAYIEEFGRYYFISAMVSANNAMWMLQLSVDVLESFKEDVLMSAAEVTRHMEEGDYLDVTPYREVRKDVDIFESNRQFRNEETILFSTIGQKIRE